ncbi:MAG: type II toxin-antitoxin system RelE/ParE family toxin [Anaerolineales bacterium]|nr:type II toxin-antitoxin system RelE/ParE family toxin [Anaerolineales bacterium]
MRYDIIFSREAANDFKKLSARERATVIEAIEQHLRHEPRKVSKSRIKRLRDLEHPQYRLRVGEIRVFYDIQKETVEVLAVVSKSRAAEWLDDVGEQ